LGAHPLFFEERPGGRRPDDRIDAAVVHDDPLDDDPAELLPTSRRRLSDSIRRPKDPRPIDVARADPIVVGQRREGGLDGISLPLVVRIGQIAQPCCFFSCWRRVVSRVRRRP